MSAVHRFETRLGWVEASTAGEALSALRFVEGAASEPSSPSALQQQVEQELKEYLEGQREDFSIALAPEGSEFQQRIWQLLAEIPFGGTLSYRELSQRYGDPKAIRAIAAANGANPIMILIPCHRVVGADGSLTGYAGGLWRKEALLDLERGVGRLF